MIQFPLVRMTDDYKPDLDPPIEEDPDDDKFISAALTSGARRIISGDKHLLRLKKYRKIEIITPAEFLKERREK